ncbi:MAG TPA: hypothetical protein VL737_00725 [Candidatus Pristimantibacillus sp.]|jgi:hypothetical protein|nr:hypothetical protein [Candidatus Pristimantibacillus sp.]
MTQYMGGRPESWGGDYGDGQLSYADTVERVRDLLIDLDDSVVIPAGGVMYAAAVPALKEYGAKDGDDHLVITIEEQAEKTARGNATSYRLVLYHLNEDRTENGQAETTTYRTNFGVADLEEYSADVADEWLAIIESARNAGWFTEFEAWFRVEDEAAETVGEFQSEALMARAMKRWRREQQRQKRDNPGTNPKAI